MSSEDKRVSLEADFATSTSLHGFSKAYNAPNRALRCLWILAILAFNAWFAYMFISMIQSYFEHNTITDMTLEFTDEVTFPAITICNYNRVDSNEVTMAELSYLSPMLYGRQMDEPALRELLGLPPAAENNTDTSTTTTPTSGFNIADIIRQRGFSLTPMRMVWCTWKGQYCTSLNFTHSFGFNGNCYTFNGDRDSPLKQTLEGVENGFKIVIDVMEYLYTEQSVTSGNSGEVGLRVLAHDQSEPPMMETHSIAIAPGSHAFMAVTQTKYRNHAPPWGKCQDLELTYYDTYTLPGCHLECRGRLVEQACGCTPYFLPGTMPPCEPQVMLECVTSVTQQLMTGDLKCDCPTPCSMTKYAAAVTYAGYPNRLTKKFYNNAYNLTPDYIRTGSLTDLGGPIRQGYRTEKEPEFGGTDMGGWCTENGVVLDIFYESLNFQTISQLKAMDAGQLASNMGGTMGLFIGASVMTLLEISEYLGLRFARLFSRRQRPLAINVEPTTVTKGNDWKQ